MQIGDQETFEELIKRIEDNDPELLEVSFSNRDFRPSSANSSFEPDNPNSDEPEAQDLANMRCFQIGQAFLKNNTVRSLNFYGCDIDIAKCMSLSTMLTQNTSINELAIVSNGDYGTEGINDQAIIYLAEAFKKNKGLKSVNLDGNKITDKEAKIIAEALKINSTIIDIDFDSNSISDIGAANFISTLEHNHSLTNLNLDNQYHTEENGLDLEVEMGIKDTQDMIDSNLWDVIHSLLDKNLAITAAREEGNTQLANELIAQKQKMVQNFLNNHENTIENQSRLFGQEQENDSLSAFNSTTGVYRTTGVFANQTSEDSAPPEKKRKADNAPSDDLTAEKKPKVDDSPSP